jgi:hypothetical protein
MLMGVLVVGVLGDSPYSAVRAVLALGLAGVVAFVAARNFDDGSSSWTARYLAGLAGALLLPLLSLGVDWG